ncbi:MAG: acyl-CoA dehydrogenase family protein [Burkholderiales bacterium]|nr:acyl-CoA dehydrogenase family protein [Burkholderiales bacterium]MCC7114159.1 acyl-CoA dehydrogenase family protein [Burkholderiales bacterium]
MEFTLPAPIDDVRRRVRAFVDERLIPLEADRVNYDEHENVREDVLARMRGEARAAGLWALQMPKSRGGGGLPFVGMAACYEEMNRSIFGPAAFNSAAPDDGNMMVLERVGTDAQKTRWLQPIVEGRVRSSFVMTEPHPGGGSDPAMIATTAEKRGDRWVVRGRKWFITGADAASHFLLIARTSDDARRGHTAFMFHRDQPGWRLLRRIPIMGPEEHGGHGELVFDGLEIDDGDRLLGVGEGLKVAQIRLGPARLTHCMRWLGLARRSLEIAQEYIGRRMSGGRRLADRESVQLQMGEAAMQVRIGRLLVMHAASKLDAGAMARNELSMAKVHVADALHRAVDTAIQLNGGRGYSKDTPLEWIYRYARQARLVDGASEVHKTVIARHLAEDAEAFFDWNRLDLPKRSTSA